MDDQQSPNLTNPPTEPAGSMPVDSTEVQQTQATVQPTVIDPNVMAQSAPTQIQDPNPIPQPAVVSVTETPQVAPTQLGMTSVPEQPSAGPAPMPDSGKKLRFGKKFMLAGAMGLFLVLGGGAAAYVTLFQKSPENLWKRALTNTGKGLEEYMNNSYTMERSGFSTTGSFKVSSPIAIDGTMDGKWSGGNGSAKASIGAAGIRVNADVVTVAEAEGSTPDMYMKVSGLDGLDDLIAGFTGISGEGSEVSSQLTEINDQWYFVDHTLLDQYLSGSAGYTEEDMKQLTTNLVSVMNQRVFTTDETRAIFKIVEKVGKEDFEGTSTYKLKVTVDKTRFKEFVTALKDAVKGTKFEDLIKAGNPDVTLEEVMSFDDILKEIEEADFSQAKADVWVEANGAFVRNIRVYPVKDSQTNYLDLGLNYKGGDDLPFEMKAVFDEEGSKGSLNLGYTINRKNSNMAMTMLLDMTSAGAAAKAEGNFTIEASQEEVKVEKPEGAKNLLELAASLQQAYSGTSDTYDYTLDESYQDSLNFELPDTLDDSEL